MPREHKTTVYTYDELSDEAKEKAREWWLSVSEGGFDQLDSEMLTEMFKDLLKEWGFKKGVDVWWSLGSSQGDGVAFQGDLDIPKYVDARAKDFRRVIGKVEAWVKHEGRYYHSNSMEAGVAATDSERDLAPKDWFPGKPTAELLDEFATFLGEDVKKMSKELEKIGYQEIEYRQSEEAIAEMLIANEYEFTADGRRFRG